MPNFSVSIPHRQSGSPHYYIFWQLISQFQFLIGSLGAQDKSAKKRDLFWFQFLIGSLGAPRLISFFDTFRSFNSSQVVWEHFPECWGKFQNRGFQFLIGSLGAGQNMVTLTEKKASFNSSQVVWEPCQLLRIVGIGSGFNSSQVVWEQFQGLQLAPTH